MNKVINQVVLIVELVRFALMMRVRIWPRPCRMILLPGNMWDIERNRYNNHAVIDNTRVDIHRPACKKKPTFQAGSSVRTRLD